MAWKSSKRPSKQRKFRHNAPLHLRRRFMRVHLSADLKLKEKMRNAPVRAGDRIKMIRGDFKGSEGKVERVDTKAYRVFVSGIERQKKDGTKALVPIAPANMMIIELNKEDKRRFKSDEKREGKK